MVYAVDDLGKYCSFYKMVTASSYYILQLLLCLSRQTASTAVFRQPKVRVGICDDNRSHSDEYPSVLGSGQFSKTEELIIRYKYQCPQNSFQIKSKFNHISTSNRLFT